MTNEPASQRIPWNLGLIFVAFLTAAGVIGQLYYSRQKEHIKLEKQDYLAAIADLKVAQISQWRSERYADGKTLTGSPFLAENILRLTGPSRTADLVSRFRRWLDAVRSANAYESVWLIDGNGRDIVTRQRDVILCLEETAAIHEALLRNGVVLSGVHKDSAVGGASLALAIPVLPRQNSKGNTGVALLLRIDATRNLFPIVNSWPTPSKTSEALLVERNGSEILYLNEQGYAKNSVLPQRVPAPGQGTPSAMAVAGVEGIVEGNDYRGIPVLAALRSIPETPWHIVVKMDLDELYAPVRELSEIVVIVLSILVFAAASWIGLVWRNQRSSDVRKSLELELKRRVVEEHFDALMRHANDGILIVDLEGKIIDVNDKALAMYGYERKEFVGLDVSETVGKEQRSEVRKRMSQVQQRNGLLFESVHQRKDGQEFPVEVSSRVITAGQKQFFQNIIRDTTDRKLAERKLRDMELRFRSLTENANDLIVVTDPRGAITYASPSVERIVGLSLTGLCGRNLEEFIHPDDVPAVGRVREQAMELPGTAFGLEHRLVDKDGGWVSFESFIKFVPLSTGRGEIIFNSRDITERKRTERYLLENEQRTRVALSGANIAVFSQTADLRYTWMYSPQPEHSPKEIVGKTDRDLFPAGDAERIIAFKRKVVSEGKGLRREITITRDGVPSYFELTVEPLKNENGDIVGITGASLDITERKKSEEQLQLQKAYFQQLFESAPEAIILMKQDECILEVNKEFTRLFGYTQEEAVGRYINDLIVPDTLKDEGLQLTNNVASGLRINAESLRRRKDGSLVHVSILGCPVTVGGGAVGVYGIYRDISDRKRAEEALKNSESSFRGLFNSVNDAIYVQDREGRFLDVNQGAIAMYGFPREYFIGKSPRDLSAPGMNDLHHVEQLVRKAFDGEPQQFEFWGVRGDGEVFPKDIRISRSVYFGQDVVVALAQDITERKKFEATLQETNKKLDSLIKASPLAITVVDLEGRIQLWNPAAEKIFGWTAEEVMGKFNPIVPKDQKEDFLRLQERILAEDQTSEMELQRRRKDGTLLEVRRSSAVLRDSLGNVKGVVAVLADITERKKALERLRESEERLRLALTAASMMTWELDLTNGHVRWSESGHEFYGMKPNDFAGTRDAFMQIIHPEDRETTAEMMEEAIRQGKDYKSEFRIVWPDGSVHWHGAYGRPLRDEHGKPILMYGIGVDITERKKSEEAIQRLHLAVEQTDEVIIMTDQAGVMTYVNPAFERLYRYSREEAIGKTPRILKSGAMSREYYLLFWRDLLAGKSIRAEHINKSKDGRIIIVEASVNPVYDAKGKLSGFIAVQEDISDRKKNEQERKRLETQLMQTQKLESIGTLAGGIAHDFNNILGIILAYSSILRNAQSSDEKSSNAVDVINQAVERGASLVRQILTFARKTDVIHGLVNVNILIKELKKMLSETFPRTITVDAEVGNDVPEIIADAAQLHQAILNICVNARDAMPAGGKLTLRTGVGTRSEVSSYFPEATNERYVHVSISDTGTGMDESTRQRIFEPFFTTKTKGKGTGLGLSVVYGVVKNHTGYVRVESEVGKGSVFHLYFPGPVRSPKPGETEQRPLLDVPGGSECILVVEDETALLDVLAGMLKSKGYRVLVARDGYEAVDTYRDHKSEIEVVVSDLGLPKMTGQDAFMRMKTINPRVKVIFGTGYLDPDLKTELLNLGARGFLAKPYSQEELLRRIRELIDCKD